MVCNSGQMLSDPADIAESFIDFSYAVSLYECIHRQNG